MSDTTIDYIINPDEFNNVIDPHKFNNVIDPREFNRLMETFSEISVKHRDPVRAHMYMDELMCNTLRSLGYEEGIRTYYETPLRYL